jgi:hypothetical protein
MLPRGNPPLTTWRLHDLALGIVLVVIGTVEQTVVNLTTIWWPQCPLKYCFVWRINRTIYTKYDSIYYYMSVYYTMHKTADTVEMRYNHSCNTLYSGDLFPGLNQEVSMWLMGGIVIWCEWVIVVLCQLSNFPPISCREQVTFDEMIKYPLYIKPTHIGSDLVLVTIPRAKSWSLHVVNGGFPFGSITQEEQRLVGLESA